MTGPGLTVDELAVVFSKAGPDLILIGGQAVGLWTREYAEQLKINEVIVSKDVDFWGSRRALTALAKRFGTKADYPDRRVMTNLSGILRVCVIDRVISIDVLHHVPGLEGAHPARSSINLSFGPHQIFALDPVSLMASKLYNLRHFQQKDRNDLAQLKVCIGVARLFIADAFLLGGARAGLNYCKRVLELALKGSNQKTIEKHSIRLYDAVPIHTVRKMQSDVGTSIADRDKLGRFLDIRWARLIANNAVS